MIKLLARLFIVWVAIIFVVSANEDNLYGWQQLVEASNEAASATTTGYAGFPPVERESCTAENALNTRKKARLQTDKSDDDLLTIGLGTRGGYPSYPSSFVQSSRLGDISVLTENPIHLANNHDPFNFKNNDPRLFPSGVSLEQVNSQASSSTTRRDFLSDFHMTRETDANASTEHYIPSPKNPPESLSESLNLGRKTKLPSDAPITQGPLGNSLTLKQDGGRGTKRRILESSGHLLSLKNGVTSDGNDAQHSDATQDFLSGFPLEQPNRLSDKENSIAMPQFSPQEIQQVIQQAIRLFLLGINTPSHDNASASRVPVFSAGGRIPWKMSSMTGQNGGNVLSSLKPPEQGENLQSWGPDQGTTSCPRAQPQQSLRVEQNVLVDWPRSTENLLKQSPSPHHNFFQSGNQGSSSGKPRNIPQLSMMHKPHQQETSMAIGNHPIQIDGIKNYGRLKFNTDLFKGEGPYQLERSYVVRLLNSIPKPSQGNFLFTDDQLIEACVVLRRRHSNMETPSITQIEQFMGNINRWYQYWSTHGKIDSEIFDQAKGALRFQFVFPLFLLYVEMIISIIPYKQKQELNVELDYQQEMGNAIKSYLEFKKFIDTTPEQGESEILMKRRRNFEQNLVRAIQRPSGIIWNFVEFWMESHYTAVWNKVKKGNCFNVCNFVKAFFNTIFALGVETLNEKLCYCVLNE